MRRLGAILPAALAALLLLAGQGGADPWSARLELLRPDHPMEYFELAEEVADGAVDDAQRDLARRLFSLAGVLDEARLGRSACLALADLAPNDRTRRRYRALAALLGEREGRMVTTGPGLTGIDRGGEIDPAALAVAEAFSRYRRGYGSKALSLLRRPGAMELLEARDRDIAGGVKRFLEDCRLYRTGQRRPSLTREEVTRMLHLESALISGGQTGWTADLLLNHEEPLIEVDPDRLAESLSVDPERPVYRAGRWVRADSAR